MMFDTGEMFVINGHSYCFYEEIYVLENLVEAMGLRKERKIFDITKPLCTPVALLETRMNCANLTEKVLFF